MAAAETVAWVKPPDPLRGLDHLGVQVPCIALYGQLFPGITNVTDRARYYSFQPSVVWAFERRYRDHSVDEFRRVLRRAECLFALIAIRHARVVGDNDDGLHGRAMVGHDKLLRIAGGFAIRDSRPAAICACSTITKALAIPTARTRRHPEPCM